MKKVTKIVAIVLAVCIVILIGLIAIISTDDSDSNQTSDTTAQTEEVEYGELLSIVDTYDTNKTVVIKVKITSSYSNESTISQNYYNVADYIKNKGYNQYEEIQYWAVADMTSGTEQKVVSFTLDSETIQKIYNGEIADNQIGDYATDLWVHQSLRDSD